MVNNTLKTISAIKDIQESNGELGANRYIISNNQTALNVMQLFAMLKIVAFKNELTVDVAPLFETIPDLENAPGVMEELYTNPEYMAHLRSRGSKQTIMLGFSDGTKDGGYLMANWGIYKAKELLTEMSRKRLRDFPTEFPSNFELLLDTSDKVKRIFERQIILMIRRRLS